MNELKGVAICVTPFNLLIYRKLGVRNFFRLKKYEKNCLIHKICVTLHVVCIMLYYAQ